MCGGAREEGGKVGATREGSWLGYEREVISRNRREDSTIWKLRKFKQESLQSTTTDNDGSQ